MIGLMAAVVFLAAVSIISFFVLQRDEFHPLDYQSPQHILTPVIHPGEKFIAETTGKCNRTDKPVAVDGNAYLRNLDTNELTLRVRADGAVRAPGCPFLRFENTMPDNAASGHYRLEGTDTATKGSKFQREGWFTEPFCLTTATGEGC